MKVYVVQANDYDEGWILGIYTTPEAAMASVKTGKWEQWKDEQIWQNERAKIVIEGHEVND